MKNSLLLLFLAVAILAAAVSAFVVVQNRRDIANAEQAAAQSAENEAIARQRAEEAQRATEEAKVRKEEAEKNRLEAANAAADAERRKIESEQKLVAERQVLADTEAKSAADNLKAKSEARAEAEAKVKAAKVEKETEALRLKTAEAEAAKAESLRAKAEAEALKLKHSLAELDQIKADYVNMIGETQALQAELEEMKRALTPEKTVKDLFIAGGDESTNLVAKAEPVKEDRRTPAERRLAALEADRDRQLDESFARTRAEIVGALERLLSRAVAERRTFDAQFYFKVIKSMYPDWTYNKSEDSK